VGYCRQKHRCRGTRGDDDEFGDDENAHQIEMWEQEIKSLRANLASDLAILHRMTHSPNRKNPYNKFAKWSAWKTNDVDKKVDKLKVKVQQLKEGVAARYLLFVSMERTLQISRHY
jgi:hypothetical protein